MSFATSTLKFLAFLMNVLCCIAGALTLSASAYALVTFDDSNAIRLPCILGVVLGSLLFLTTILGCCGAIRESQRAIWTYAVFLLLLMAAQIAVIFLLSIDFQKLAMETITNAWNRQLSEEGIMAQYEIKYACCGKTSPNDYNDSGLRIPPSCYKNQNSTLSVDLYTEGCAASLAEAYSNGSQIEEISDWSLIGVEGVTIIVACMLAISFKNLERRRRYH